MSKRKSKDDEINPLHIWGSMWSGAGAPDRSAKTDNKDNTEEMIKIANKEKRMGIAGMLGQFAVLIICMLAFFSLVLNLSWRYYPLGFLIGYTLADVIRRITLRVSYSH